MASEVAAITPFRFECTACGKCCLQQHGGAVLYLSDIEAIANFLNLSPAEFVERYCRFRVYRGVGRKGAYAVPDLRLNARAGKCVFLSGKLCSIHEVKPYLCKAAPFISELVGDPSVRRLFAETCDGYGEGPLHGREEIAAHLRREMALESADRDGYRDGTAERLGVIERPRVGKR